MAICYDNKRGTRERQKLPCEATAGLSEEISRLHAHDVALRVATRLVPCPWRATTTSVQWQADGGGGGSSGTRPRTGRAAASGGRWPR